MKYENSNEIGVFTVSRSEVEPLARKFNISLENTVENHRCFSNFFNFEYCGQKYHKTIQDDFRTFHRLLNSHRSVIRIADSVLFVGSFDSLEPNKSTSMALPASLAHFSAKFEQFVRLIEKNDVIIPIKHNKASDKLRPSKRKQRDEIDIVDIRVLPGVIVIKNSPRGQYFLERLEYFSSICRGFASKSRNKDNLGDLRSIGSKEQEEAIISAAVIDFLAQSFPQSAHKFNLYFYQQLCSSSSHLTKSLRAALSELKFELFFENFINKDSQSFTLHGNFSIQSNLRHQNVLRKKNQTQSQINSEFSLISNNYKNPFQATLFIDLLSSKNSLNFTPTLVKFGCKPNNYEKSVKINKSALFHLWLLILFLFALIIVVLARVCWKFNRNIFKSLTIKLKPTKSIEAIKV